VPCAHGIGSKPETQGVYGAVSLGKGRPELREACDEFAAQRLVIDLALDRAGAQHRVLAARFAVGLGVSFFASTSLGMIVCR
jgi:hypothetical protein